MKRTKKHERGIPWRDIPIGPFEGALYFWVGRPPHHSSRLERSLYIKTCNALVALNGTTWSFDTEGAGWYVVGYRPIEFEAEEQKGTNDPSEHRTRKHRGRHAGAGPPRQRKPRA